MKQFKICENPQGDYEAVKQGWSWVAFFFTGIWAMIAKMWGLGVGVLIGMIVLEMMVGASGSSQDDVTIIDIIYLVVYIVVRIIFGIKGNKWRESSLSRRGYKFKKTVTAANKEDAIALVRAPQEIKRVH